MPLPLVYEVRQDHQHAKNQVTRSSCSHTVGTQNDAAGLVARVRHASNANSEQPRPAANSVGRRVYHCAAHTSTGTVHEREAKSMGVSKLDYSAPRASMPIKSMPLPLVYQIRQYHQHAKNQVTRSSCSHTVGTQNDAAGLVSKVRHTNNTNSEQPCPAANSAGRRVYHCAAHTSTGTLHETAAKSMGVSKFDYSAPRASMPITSMPLPLVYQTRQYHQHAKNQVTRSSYIRTAGKENHAARHVARAWQ